jgi:PLP dependent protein
MVETVDREKIADALQKGLEDHVREDPLKILVQVNPAEEDTKSGITDNESLIKLVQHIRDKCPKLQFQGLMVIGRPGKLEDLDQLVAYKSLLIKEFPDLEQLSPFELSMGMSDDYKEAVRKLLDTMGMLLTPSRLLEEAPTCALEALSLVLVKVERE